MSFVPCHIRGLAQTVPIVYMVFMAVVRFLRELGAFPANYYGQVRRFVPRLLREIHFEGRGYGLIQPFQQPERVIGFFNAYREGQLGDAKSFARYCSAISELGQEPLPKVGCAHAECAGGKA